MPRKSLGCIFSRITTQLFSLLTCLYNMHSHHQSCSTLSLEYNWEQKSNTQLGKGIQEGHKLLSLVGKESFCSMWFLSFMSFEQGLSKEPSIWGILASSWAAAVRAGSSCTAASPSGKAESSLLVPGCQSAWSSAVWAHTPGLVGQYTKNFIKN